MIRKGFELYTEGLVLFVFSRCVEVRAWFLCGVWFLLSWRVTGYMTAACKKGAQRFFVLYLWGCWFFFLLVWPVFVFCFFPSIGKFYRNGAEEEKP